MANTCEVHLSVQKVHKNIFLLIISLSHLNLDVYLFI